MSCYKGKKYNSVLFGYTVLAPCTIWILYLVYLGYITVSRWKSSIRMTKSSVYPCVWSLDLFNSLTVVDSRQPRANTGARLLLPVDSPIWGWWLPYSSPELKMCPWPKHGNEWICISLIHTFAGKCSFYSFYRYIIKSPLYVQEAAKHNIVPVPDCVLFIIQHHVRLFLWKDPSGMHAAHWT